MTLSLPLDLERFEGNGRHRRARSALQKAMSRIRRSRLRDRLLVFYEESLRIGQHVRDGLVSEHDAAYLLTQNVLGCGIAESRLLDLVRLAARDPVAFFQAHYEPELRRLQEQEDAEYRRRFPL